MIKSILNPKAVDKVIERVKSLYSQTPPLWGKMTASEMLSHCNMAHQSIFKAWLDVGCWMTDDRGLVWINLRHRDIERGKRD